MKAKIALLLLLCSGIIFAKPPSLKNPHNFCYLNAALQALNSLNVFTDEIEKVHAEIFYAENTLPHAFCNFVNAIKKGKYETELKKIQDIAAPLMLQLAGGAEACGQQDASEFVNKLLDDFRSKTDVGDIPALITQLFYLVNKPVVACPSAEANKPKTYVLEKEELSALNLAMLTRDNATLDELLNIYKNEKNYEYRGLKNCAKQSNITYSPIVIINLQRFKVLPGQAIMKNDRPVQMPLRTKFNGTEYELKSFIVQSGTAYGGHYIAYVKEGNTWWKCDDVTITQVKTPGVAIGKGYNYFYQSVSKPITEPTQPEGSEPTKEPVEKPLEEPDKGPAKEPITEPILTPLEPITQPIQKPEEPAEGPLQQPEIEPIQKPTKEPVEKPLEEPDKGPAKEPITEPILTPLEPITQPVQKPEEPAKGPLQQPEIEPIQKPTKAISSFAKALSDLGTALESLATAFSA